MTLPLWPLPLLAALLPLAAAVLAWQLSLAAGTVPDCNLFVDGCASISRAGRHGLANIVFRGLVLPAAVLQALVWVLAPGWLRTLGVQGGRTLPWIGLVAGVCLLPLLALAHLGLPWVWPERRDALENVTEWWGGAIFTVFFASLAWAWWRSGYACQLRGASPPAV